MNRTSSVREGGTFRLTFRPYISVSACDLYYFLIRIGNVFGLILLSSSDKWQCICDLF